VSNQEFNGQFHEGSGSGKGLNEETHISIHAIHALHLDYIISEVSIPIFRTIKSIPKITYIFE
jgi:hypothetical protein